MEEPTVAEWNLPGWRIEQKYSTDVLIGNWNEERRVFGCSDSHFGSTHRVDFKNYRKFVPDITTRRKALQQHNWRRPEDKPTPIIWFSVFVIGLFLNVFSISVSASELCTSTASVIFYVVNGFGIILDAALLYCWWTKCLFYWRKWCALNQEWSTVVGNGKSAPQGCSQEEEVVEELYKFLMIFELQSYSPTSCFANNQFANTSSLLEVDQVLWIGSLNLLLYVSSMTYETY